MNTPKVGEIVDLRHERFGRATVRILSVNGEWVDTEIIKGRLVGMQDEWRAGDQKTVRLCHCTFYPTAKNKEATQ